MGIRHLPVRVRCEGEQSLGMVGSVVLGLGLAEGVQCAASKQVSKQVKAQGLRARARTRTARGDCC